MEYESKNPTPEIAFLNEPKMSDHEVDKNRNERRTELMSPLKNFLANHERFQGKKVSVAFSLSGVSSLIAFLETPEEKLVIKIPLRDDLPEGESKFLQEWEKVGVRVPHIIEEGVIGKRPYTIMEYIDGETLSTKYSDKELLERGAFTDMGKILRTMHLPEVEGFGHILDSKPEYSDFKSWLQNSMSKKRSYTKEHKLLFENEHGSLDTATKILLEYGETCKKSAYCHYDYGSYNIFASKPLTVFDDPMLNLPYIDLGRSIVIGPAGNGIPEAVNQFTEGYAYQSEPIDRKILQASMLVNSVQKFPYWNKTKKQKRIKNVQEYLANTKHFLES